MIDRDSYGSIPLYYSIHYPIISTDLRFIIKIEKPDLDFEALCEYLSTSYLTGNKTIYKTIHTLLPNQIIHFHDNKIAIKSKKIFPEIVFNDPKEISHLFEKALDHSIQDYLERFPSPMLLNLSGGTDSTLLLAKMSQSIPKKSFITTTFFHDDWRDDLNDWEYAAKAAAQYGSNHRLIKINNALFTQGHAELVTKANTIFHTYATAFYLQNQLACPFEEKIPIINGSGPDESMIGTEKINITELIALNALKRENWKDYLIHHIDYIKIPEEQVEKMLRNSSKGFTEKRRLIASELSEASHFVEYQRQYHVMTILQDHIRELTSVAQVLGHPIIFPYLTNDIFKIIFSSRFDALNADGVYKSTVKKILEKYMPYDFVHRKKIGFQSPSRIYFKNSNGLGSMALP